MEDFHNASQRAIGALADKPAKEGEEEVEIEDLDDASIDRLYARTKKDFDRFDASSMEVEYMRKEFEKEQKEYNAKVAKLPVGAKPPPGPDAEKLQADVTDYIQDSLHRLEDSLESFTLRIRAQFVGRKDLGPKFSHAANELFLDLKKIAAEVDKFAATELKRKPKEDKPLEVIPSKFLADFKGILKKVGPEEPDDKQKKCIKSLEDFLKRVDTNHSFSKVTSLCETAQSGINELIKSLGKDEPKFAKELKDLYTDIEKYDDHMFLMGRL